MIALAPHAAAREARAASPARPATAILHDGPDARLVVFRLAPGQGRAAASEPVHRDAHGAERRRRALRRRRRARVPGRRRRGLRAARAARHAHHDAELLLLATITPRPGAR
jgi:hypothetical protein